MGIACDGGQIERGGSPLGQGPPVARCAVLESWCAGRGALPHWQLGDEGPQEDEASFCSADWGHHFEQRRAEWNEAMAGQRVDQVWSVLEDTLVNCHRLNSSGFQRPRGRTVTKAEEAPQDPYSGEVYTQAARAPQHRRRILQQLLILHGRPGREEAVKQLRTTLCRAPAPEWAMWGTFPLTQTALEGPGPSGARSRRRGSRSRA